MRQGTFAALQAHTTQVRVSTQIPSQLPVELHAMAASSSDDILPGEVPEEALQAAAAEVKAFTPSCTDPQSGGQRGETCGAGELRETADAGECSAAGMPETSETKNQEPVASVTGADAPPVGQGFCSFCTSAFACVKRAKKRYHPHATAAGMTLVYTFFSLSFIFTITNIEPYSFQPCNDPSAAGCLYMKFFSAGNVTTTAGYFASVLNGQEDIVTGFGWQFSNREEVESQVFEGVWGSWKKDTVILRSVLSNFFAEASTVSVHQPPARCLNMTADEMREYCTRIEVKEGTQNHLRGPGRDVFVFFTALWCISSIAHDFLVLEKRRQPAAFLSIVAIATQLTAASTAAYWALGSTSVFISPHQSEDCACFYQMPAVQALLTLVSPMLLLKGSFEEARHCLRGFVYGDFLHFQRYRIPHHVEQSSSSWLSGHLMVWRDAVAPQDRMHPHVYAKICLAWCPILIVAEGAILLLIAPLAPSSIVRAEEVVVKFLSAADSQMEHVLYTILDWILFFTSWTSLLPAFCSAGWAFGWRFRWRPLGAVTDAVWQIRMALVFFLAAGLRLSGLLVFWSSPRWPAPPRIHCVEG